MADLIEQRSNMLITTLEALSCFEVQRRDAILFVVHHESFGPAAS